MPSYTITSAPDGGEALQLLSPSYANPASFAIPSSIGGETVTSATLSFHHARNIALTGAADFGTQFDTSSGNCQAASHVGNGTYSDTATLSAAMIADMQAAAGGDLDVSFSYWYASGSALIGPSDTDSWGVGDFTLSVTTAPLFITPPTNEAIALLQPVPGTVSLVRSVSSVNPAVSVAGGEGSARGAQITVSEPTGALNLTQLSAGAVTKTGALKFALNRDNRGKTWTAEWTVAATADSESAGVAWMGNQWGCLYSNGGQVYFKTSPRPDDWTVNGPITLTGITGRVYGLACNQVGILCGIVDKAPVVSLNRGATWTKYSDISGLTPPCSITSLLQYFLVAMPVGSSVRHWRSRDGGETFQ